MENKIKRPPAIWMAQALLVLNAALISLGITMYLFVASATGFTPDIVSALICMSVFVIFPLFACFSLVVPNPFGRYLDCTSLIGQSLFMVFKVVASDSPDLPIILTVVVVAGLSLSLCIALFFTKSASNFFIAAVP